VVTSTRKYALRVVSQRLDRELVAPLGRERLRELRHGEAALGDLARLLDGLGGVAVPERLELATARVREQRRVQICLAPVVHPAAEPAHASRDLAVALGLRDQALVLPRRPFLHRHRPLHGGNRGHNRIATMTA
jgi:hypothetical protein